MRASWILYLYSFRNESGLKKTFATGKSKLAFPLLSRWDNGVNYRGVNILTQSFPRGSLDIFQMSPWWQQSDFLPFSIRLKQSFLFVSSTYASLQLCSCYLSVSMFFLVFYLSPSSFSLSVWLNLCPHFLSVSILVLIISLLPSIFLFSVCLHPYSFFMSVFIFFSFSVCLHLR